MSRVRKILFCIVLGLLAAMFALSAYFAIGIQISGGELGQWGWLDNDSTCRVHRKVDDRLRPTVEGVTVKFVTLKRGIPSGKERMKLLPFPHTEEIVEDRVTLWCNWTLDVSVLDYELDYLEDGEWVTISEYTNTLSDSERFVYEWSDQFVLPFEAGTFDRPGQYRLYVKNVSDCEFEMTEG